ncbi:MAG: MmcB family DNA repair protein [Pseudomonadota bacterium]
MPIVSPVVDNPFVDARQSQRALAVRTGCERYFWDRNWATLPELSLANGRRVDLVALSPKGEIAIVEVKSSVADLRADHKWPEYQAFCDALFFATLPDVPAEIFPQETGFMVADVYGAELVRDAPQIKLTAARRKAVHLTFARASAQRLARCCAHMGEQAGAFVQEDEG